MAEEISGGDLGWRAQLPDALKTNEVLAGFKTVGEVGQAHLDLMGKHSELDGKLKDALFLPGEKATDAERATFYTKIGRPEKPDGYEIKIPEGLPADDDAVKWFKETAHSLGLSKTQAEKFVAGYFDNMKAGLATVDAQIKSRQEETSNTLKKEWGGKYQENFDLAKKTAQRIGGEDIMKFLNETGAGDHPAMIRFMHKLGGLVSESAFIEGSPAPAKEIQRTDGGMPMLDFPSMKKT